MDKTFSINNVPVRLTAERWFHIEEEHSELASYYHDVLETVADPDVIFAGNDDELLAVRSISEGKFIVVVYKETGADDGFIITAFLIRQIARLQRRKVIWQRPM